MPYEGGDLRDLFSRSTVGPPTDRALRDIAHAGGERLTGSAAEHTPTDTGRTRERWRTLPVERVPEGYASGTENPSQVARFLEYGTSPHTIGPEQQEAVETPEGPRAEVHHPGTHGHHMLAKASAEVEAELPAIAQPHLSEWAASIEANAKRHKGIT